MFCCTVSWLQTCSEACRAQSHTLATYRCFWTSSTGRCYCTPTTWRCCDSASRRSSTRVDISNKSLPPPGEWVISQWLRPTPGRSPSVSSEWPFEALLLFAWPFYDFLFFAHCTLWMEKGHLLFLPRDAMQARPMLSCGVHLCVRPSVCPSVTFVHSVKTSNRTFIIISLSGSQTILVFPYQTSSHYSDENPRNGGVECRWGAQIEIVGQNGPISGYRSMTAGANCTIVREFVTTRFKISKN